MLGAERPKPLIGTRARPAWVFRFVLPLRVICDPSPCRMPVVQFRPGYPARRQEGVSELDRRQPLGPAERVGQSAAPQNMAVPLGRGFEVAQRRIARLHAPGLQRCMEVGYGNNQIQCRCIVGRSFPAGPSTVWPAGVERPGRTMP